MKRDEVTLCQYVIQANLFGIARIGWRDHIVKDHGHAQCRCLPAQQAADVAEADEPQCLAGDLAAFELFLFPLACGHAHRRLGDAAGQGQHVAKGQFGHRVGAGLGGVAHGDALAGGILDVDVVQSDATADDNLQVGGCVQHGLRDLGAAADHHAVIVGRIAE